MFGSSKCFLLIGPTSYLGACYVYAYEGNEMHLWENDAVLFVGEPLNHIHQDTKSAV